MRLEQVEKRERELESQKGRGGKRELEELSTGDSENQDILSMLNQDNLEQIKKDFKRKDNGLDISQFVMVMLHHLKECDNKIQRVESLLELFRQIDVNGDETMEWEEFTNYIVELGMVRKDDTFIDSIKEYYMSHVKDEEKHEAEVEYMFYFGEKLNQLLIMERDNKKFKVYDATTGKCENRGVTGHTGAVIAAEYIKEQDIIVTSANDNSLNFWDAQTYIFRARKSTPEIQMASITNIYIYIYIM